MEVVVVGAGLAGLACAYELARRGRRVTLLEARSYLGGRVRTVRDWTFVERGEGGAEFIDSHHAYVLRYARHFRLELTPISLWRDLRPEPESDGRQWEQAWLSLRELASGLPSPRKPWRVPPELQEWDKLSLSQWARRERLNPAVREWFEAWSWGVEAAPPHDLSMLGVLAEQRQVPERARASAYTFEDGNDSLALALLEAAQRHGAVVQKDCPVKVIVDRSGRVEVRGPSVSVSADKAVITVPAPALSGLEIRPALPATLRRALGKTSYGAVIKTLLEYGHRVWPEEGYFVHMGGGEVNSVWESARARRGSLMVAWVTGEWAHRWSQLSERQRLEKAVAEVERLLPGSSAHYLQGRSFDWVGDPYSRGAYSYFGLGFLSRYGGDLDRPFGNLHFAGEHTSPFAGYMNGALESGVRAARQILSG